MRKGSFTSCGTGTNQSNASQTNVTSRAADSSNNTSRVQSSDEAHMTPELQRPKHVTSKADRSPSKRQRSEGEKLGREKSKTAEEERHEALRQIICNSDVIERVLRSSDERIMTPRAERPRLDVTGMNIVTRDDDVTSDSDNDAIDGCEQMRSSDEACMTPELQRPATAALTVR